MAKKNFLLLSLEDDKAKKIANAINNTSCKKILDYLTENEATETEISKALNLPISTVHYNLKQLLESKLIVWEKYHYSEKGKEVRHYTVANKYVIIAPKGDHEGIREKLKSIIPMWLLIGLGTLGIWFANQTNNLSSSLAGAQEAMPLMAKSREIAYDQVADDAVYEAAPLATNLVQETAIYQAPSIWQTILQSEAFYFFLGAVFTLLCVYIIKKIRNHKKNKKQNNLL